MPSEISQKADILKIQEKMIAEIREMIRRIDKGEVGRVKLVVGGMCSYETSVDLNDTTKKAILTILRAEEKAVLGRRKKLLAEMQELTK